MKATTTTRKTSRRREQPAPATTPPTLEISPFTVTTEWVKVTIPISKSDAELLDSSNQTVRDGIGSVVSVFGSKPNLANKYGEDVEPYKYIVAKVGRQPTGETRPWSFSLKRWEWDSVVKTAGILSTTPEQVARAAISKRVSQIREFLARRPATR